MTISRSQRITYEDVEGLCNGLVNSGRLPSGIAVREVWRMLGRGSLSTVSKFIDRWLASIKTTAATHMPNAVTPPLIGPAPDPDANADEVDHDSKDRTVWDIIDVLTATQSKQVDLLEQRAISLHAKSCGLAMERDAALRSLADAEVKLAEADIRCEQSRKREQQAREQLLESEAGCRMLAEAFSALIEQLTPPRWFDRHPAFQTAKRLVDKYMTDNSND
jgi:hypothetical protein